MTKWVYSFGKDKNEGDRSMRNLLGGKGCNLAEMASLGLPGFPGLPGAVDGPGAKVGFPGVATEAAGAARAAEAVALEGARGSMVGSGAAALAGGCGEATTPTDD